jgi:hypothetical protein
MHIHRHTHDTSTRSLSDSVHPLLQAVLNDWLNRSGALSARPDAPVVPPRHRRWLPLRRDGRGDADATRVDK